jgi:hypothetical protein
MATRQELENRLAQIDAELQVLRNSLDGRSNVELDSEIENRFLAERTRLRNQRSVIQSQLDRILVSDARSFYAETDLGTGLVQIRTSDGLFAGRGSTLEDAKAAAIRNGANASALINLVDPQAKASATQGSGTVSTGTTVSQGQQANADRADSQSPALSTQTVTAAGAVTNAPASANPSNASPSQTPVPTAPPTPNALPPGQVGGVPDPAATVPAARGSQSPGAALQSGLVNLQSADIDNTLVSYVYRATQVTSSFRQGRFTQEIEGAQVFFQLPKKPQPTAPQTESVAVTPGRGVTPAVPQGTVRQSAATPGTFNLGVNLAGSEFGAFFGTGETGEQSQLVDGALPGSVPGGLRPPGSPPAQRVLPGSTFEAEGFGDPTAVQGTAQAPLQSRPPTSGTTNIAPRSRGNRGNTPEPTKVAPQQGAREY